MVYFLASLTEVIMATERYLDREVQVICFDDVTSVEFVIEFRDPLISASDSLIAIFCTDLNWEDAKLTVNPAVDGVSAPFLVWALGIGRQLITRDSGTG